MNVEMNLRCDLLAVSVLLLIAPAKTIYMYIQWTSAKTTGVR